MSLRKKQNNNNNNSIVGSSSILDISESRVRRSEKLSNSVKGATELSNIEEINTQ